MLRPRHVHSVSKAFDTVFVRRDDILLVHGRCSGLINADGASFLAPYVARRLIIMVSGIWKFVWRQYLSGFGGGTRTVDATGPRRRDSESWVPANIPSVPSLLSPLRPPPHSPLPYLFPPLCLPSSLSVLCLDRWLLDRA